MLVPTSLVCFRCTSLATFDHLFLTTIISVIVVLRSIQSKGLLLSIVFDQISSDDFCMQEHHFVMLYGYIPRISHLCYNNSLVISGGGS